MDLTKVSKYISLILRHKPETIGITLDEHGWADVKQLIKGVSEKYSDFNIAVLEFIVKNDEKQRYSYNEDHTKIRANQGHSIPVDLDLKPINPPKYLYHGTGEKYIWSIESSGLISKSRQYVHLSDSIETATDVGSRHGAPVVYRVNTTLMTDAGFIFYRSENGVWLTELVPVWAIERVK